MESSHSFGPNVYANAFCVYVATPLQAAPNKGVDQTALMCRMICNFVVRMQ